MRRSELQFEIVFPERPRHRCPVRFGCSLLADAASHAAGLAAGGTVALISDAVVAPLWADKMLDELTGAGAQAVSLSFPSGERNKTLATLADLLERLSANRIGRDGLVVALGGGVTGDLAGLAAALHCRGIKWIQMPTTTCAMADSAVGGKTAVNAAGAKNRVGAFHQPSAIFADLDTLGTLPRRHLVAGLAEVIKTAVALDAELFEQLEAGAGHLPEPDGPLLASSLARCARLKGRIVAEDEREFGRRAVLNTGHTIGHAVEAAGLGSLLHGEAVAIGLAIESAIAVEETGFPGRDRERLMRLLRAVSLPTRIPAGISSNRIGELLGMDKKSRGARPRFCLLDRIGAMHRRGGEWTAAIDEGLVERALRSQ